MKRQTHHGAQSATLHALAVKECMPLSLLNYGSAMVHLVAVMDAER